VDDLFYIYNEASTCYGSPTVRLRAVSNFRDHGNSPLVIVTMILQALIKVDGMTEVIEFSVTKQDDKR
jgi:hypothetical protein